MLFRLSRRLFNDLTTISTFKNSLYKSRFADDKELLTICSEVSKLKYLNLYQRFGKTLEFDTFIDTLQQRAQTMTLDDQKKVLKIMIDNKEFRNRSLTNKFWSNLADGLTKNIQDMTLQDKLDIIREYALIHITGHEVTMLINNIFRSLEEVSIEDMRKLSISQLVDLLWAINAHMRQNPTLFQTLSKAALIHPDLESTDGMLLAKFINFISKNEINKKYCDPKLCEILNNLLKNFILNDINIAFTDITNIAHFIIPLSYNDDGLKSLIEEKLVQSSSEMNESVFIINAIRIFEAFKTYNFTNPNILNTLHDLLEKYSEAFDLNEISSLLFIMAHKKKSYKVQMQTLNKIFGKKLKKNEEITFRKFTDLIIDYSNSGMQTAKIWDNLEKIAIKHLQRPNMNTHYLLKILIIFCYEGSTNTELIEFAVDKIINEDLITKTEHKNLCRLVAAVAECSQLQDPRLIEFLENKLFECIDYVYPNTEAKALYSLVRISKGSPNLFKLYSKRFLEKNIGLMTPIALGQCCYAFGKTNENNFIRGATYYVDKWLNGKDKIEFKNEKQVDEEGDAAGCENFSFNKTFPATAAVQMAWMMSKSKYYIAETFWSEHVINLLNKIQLGDYTYTLNDWLVDPMYPDEEKALTVDQFHYDLLQSIPELKNSKIQK